MSEFEREPCAHEDCVAWAIPCFLPGGEAPHEWLCGTHAAEAGYCSACGDFWGGIESFEFRHPRLCDNCHDELAEPEDDELEDPSWVEEDEEGPALYYGLPGVDP